MFYLINSILSFKFFKEIYINKLDFCDVLGFNKKMNLSQNRFDERPRASDIF